MASAERIAAIVATHQSNDVAVHTSRGLSEDWNRRRYAECVHHIRDVHVTILRLLGLDDRRLTYFHAGRFKQLSQFGGQVIGELLA